MFTCYIEINANNKPCKHLLHIVSDHYAHNLLRVYSYPDYDNNYDRGPMRSKQLLCVHSLLSDFVTSATMLFLKLFIQSDLARP
jgi:hypothetical protein